MMRSEQLPRTTAILAVATVVAMSLAACKSDDTKPPVPPTTVTVTTEAQTPTVTTTETITPSEDPTVTSTATYVRTAKVAPPEPTTTELQLPTDAGVLDESAGAPPAIKDCTYQGSPVYGTGDTLDCATALKVVTDYHRLRETEGTGRGRFLTRGNWTCSTLVAVIAREKNISVACHNPKEYEDVYLPLHPNEKIKPYAN